VKAEEFRVWTLKLNPHSSALLTCDDGNGHIVYDQSIPFTDYRFPVAGSEAVFLEQRPHAAGRVLSRHTRRASALRVFLSGE
jgi:hypothetical protein